MSPDESLKRILARAGGGRVIWDFDGVIVDSEPLQAESYRIMLEPRAAKPPEAFFRLCVGQQEHRIWEMLGEAGLLTGDEPIDRLIAEREPLVRGLLEREAAPSWLATELVPMLAEHGIPQHIVSAGNPETIEALLAHWRLGEHLEYTPAPGQKRARLEQFWSSSPTVTFEDNHAYLAAAKQAGSFTVEVRHAYSPYELAGAHLMLDIDTPPDGLVDGRTLTEGAA